VLTHVLAHVDIMHDAMLSTTTLSVVALLVIRVIHSLDATSWIVRYFTFSCMCVFCNSFLVAPVERKAENPCVPSPCGPNSQCRVIGSQAACSCLPNYVGQSPNCRPECSINAECPSNLACINERCKDPCPGSCGLNARCSVVNHNAVCTCLEGYEGDSTVQCSLIPPPRKTIPTFFRALFHILINFQIQPLHVHQLPLHAIPRHVDQMLNVERTMELEHASAMKATKEIHLTNPEVADENAKSIVTVQISWLVSGTSASTHVWELAVPTPFVRSRDIHLCALVLQDTPVIHSSYVEKNQSHLVHRPIHVFPHHVARTRNAEKSTTKQSARVFQATLEVHQVAVQNVLSIQNAPQTWLASIKNVLILVQILVASKLAAKL
jgi:hypothetical protein